MTWHYKRFFSCDSKDVLYVLIWNICDFSDIGQKSDVIHPNNSNCKKCAEHLRTCSKMKEPYFNIYAFLNEENRYLLEFKERRYKINWEPQLNSDQQISFTH